MSKKNETPTHAKDAAIAAIGGVAETARKLGISPQAVSQWEIIPVKHVLRMEELSGISRHRQRPDIYPNSEAA
jgi:DNA-binding transcriptional regulator YdaS (Cro superfamily)